MASIAKFLLKSGFLIIELLMLLLFVILITLAVEFIPIVSDIMKRVGSLVKDFFTLLADELGVSQDSYVTGLLLFFVGIYYWDKIFNEKWEFFKDKFINNALKIFSKD